jgi:hypothetical protein
VIKFLWKLFYCEKLCESCVFLIQESLYVFSIQKQNNYCVIDLNSKIVVVFKSCFVILQFYIRLQVSSDNLHYMRSFKL